MPKLVDGSPPEDMDTLCSIVAASAPETEVARDDGYMSDDIVEDFRSYCRACTGEYGPVAWELRLSPPKDIDRGGGGYGGQGRPSRVAESASTGAFHPADGGGWGVYGEKEGVIGDSCGYPLHAPPMSPDFAGFGLCSVDIQVAIPWPAKSNGRPDDDALPGT